MGFEPTTGRHHPIMNQAHLKNCTTMSLLDVVEVGKGYFNLFIMTLHQ